MQQNNLQVTNSTTNIYTQTQHKRDVCQAVIIIIISYYRLFFTIVKCYCWMPFNTANQHQ